MFLGQLLKDTLRIRDVLVLRRLKSGVPVSYLHSGGSSSKVQSLTPLASTSALYFCSMSYEMSSSGGTAMRVSRRWRTAGNRTSYVHVSRLFRNVIEHTCAPEACDDETYQRHYGASDTLRLGQRGA